MSGKNIENQLHQRVILHQLLFIISQVLTDINFNENCLINDIYIPKKVINIYISSTLNLWPRNSNGDFTINSCLYESVTLNKNVHPDKYKYSGYGIGFDSCSEFLFTDASMEKNVIVFGADISSYVHIDNKNRNILTLGEGPRNSRRKISY